MTNNQSVPNQTDDIFHSDNTNNVILSVIIPVYNAEKYIAQCLDSVLNQSVKNLEVICVDDCSDDNSVEIVKKYVESDNRIKLFINNTNKTAGYCRNLGVRESSGEYIHFLDADDWLEADAYEKALKLIRDSKSDICVFYYNKYDNVTTEITCPKLFRFETGDIKNLEEESGYFFNTSVVPWNKVFNASFIKSNDIKFDELICANDRTFYFTAVSKAEKVVFLKEAIINYRVNNSDSLVGNARNEHYDCHFKSYFSTREKIFDCIDLKSKMRFVYTSITDIIGFYHKIKTNKDVLKNMTEFFASIKGDIALLGEELALCPWSAELEILLKLKDKDLSNVIPIVFATNENYAPYAAVAIQSLIDNVNDYEREYCIFVLYSKLEQRYIDLTSSLARDNVSITFVNVDAKIESETKKLYSRAHYSKEMYYRILIADLFRPFSKVLYLDCDIIVRKDVAELYYTDIGDNILGGVVNFSADQMGRYIQNVLHIAPKKYVNSGILLFNCEEFRNHYIKEHCFHLVSQTTKYVCPDQDVLNITCKDKIYYLDSKWNFQWYNHILEPNRDENKVMVPEIKPIYENAIEGHGILHFTSGIKAWNSPDRKNAYIFWEYAKTNPFYDEIRCKNIAKIISLALNAKEMNELREKNARMSDKLEWNRNEVKRLTKRVRELEKKANEAKEIRASATYKIGRFFTWLPRKIRSLLKKG